MTAELTFFVGREGAYAKAPGDPLRAAAFTTPPESWWRMWGRIHDASSLCRQGARVTQVQGGTGALENVFSIMGWQTEKRRNRMLSLRIHKLTTVHLALKDKSDSPAWWDLAEMQDK
eukprot:Hpha_TRINITY_DN16335_c0_g2::TRINITY_DN16335_c0_g2_i2::g.59827::m.59827